MPGSSAVTVIAPDPVEAEVLSKSLFLEGRRRIADEAARVGRGGVLGALRRHGG